MRKTQKYPVDTKDEYEYNENSKITGNYCICLNGDVTDYARCERLNLSASASFDIFIEALDHL
jgi:hypothetical protein